MGRVTLCMGREGEKGEKRRKGGREGGRDERKRIGRRVKRGGHHTSLYMNLKLE